MISTHRKTDCRCVSDKDVVTVYAEPVGEIVVFKRGPDGCDLEVTAPIYPAKIRCQRCRRLTLEKITLLQL